VVATVSYIVWQAEVKDRVETDLQIEPCADFIVSAAARRSILVGGGGGGEAWSAQFIKVAYLFQKFRSRELTLQ